MIVLFFIKSVLKLFWKSIFPLFVSIIWILYIPESALDKFVIFFMTSIAFSIMYDRWSEFKDEWKHILSILTTYIVYRVSMLKGNDEEEYILDSFKEIAGYLEKFENGVLSRRIEKWYDQLESKNAKVMYNNFIRYIFIF